MCTPPKIFTEEEKAWRAAHGEFEPCDLRRFGFRDKKFPPEDSSPLSPEEEAELEAWWAAEEKRLLENPPTPYQLEFWPSPNWWKRAGIVEPPTPERFTAAYKQRQNPRWPGDGETKRTPG